MSRTRIGIYAAISLIPLVAALWIAGFDPNYLLGNYVTTTDAFVTGDLVQASAPAGGQVTKILTDVGDNVQSGQTVAYLVEPAQPTTRLPLVPQVRAPGAGTVVHLSVLVGQNVAAGQSVATIADLSKLWVVAPVDEGSFSMVRQGQAAQVYIPALNQYFNGEVSQLLPDMSETAPRTAGAASTTSATRSNNEVPVRVDFSYGSALVYPGMTANVTIYVRR
jgi:multidrug resistance efflux pump